MISDPESLAVLNSEYEEAERAIKTYERVTLSAPIAAINQLRYAGFHILRSYCESDAIMSRQHIDKAIAHCTRAFYDAMEGVIYAQLEFLRDFQNLCRSRKNVQSVYADYVPDYERICDLKEQFESLGSVQQMAPEQRDTVIRLSAELAELKRRVLRNKVKVERLEQAYAVDSVRLIAQQFLVPFVATIVGTVVGALGLLAAIWPMFPANVWGRVGGVIVLFALGYFAVKRFFCWSVAHMLSNEQRAVLRGEYGLKL